MSSNFPDSRQPDGGVGMEFGWETELIHGDDSYLGELALAPSMDMSVTFRTAPGNRPNPGHKFYSRFGNPTVDRLAVLLAKLEEGEAAIATSSGMSAGNLVLFSLLNAGDRVVIHDEMYSEMMELVEDYGRFGVDVDVVSEMTPDSLRSVLTPETRIVWVESPTNPLLTLVDITAVAEVCHESGALCVVDNTLSTGNQLPLRQGADVVVISATKIVSGHSDLVAGAVVASTELIDRLKGSHTTQGALCQPFEAWLTMRSIRTLALRLEAQNRSAQRVAEALEAHPAVERVYYPGLESHPNHEVAVAQMRGYGSLLSFVVKGGYEAARLVRQALVIPAEAPSLGAVHSLVIHPAEGWVERDYRPHQRSFVPEGLLRLSVGLENPEDLIADLTGALGKHVH